MQTLVKANGKNYLVDLPAIRGIGNVYIAVASFLWNNGTDISKIVFGQTVTNTKLQGKKAYATSAKTTFARSTWTGEYPVGKGYLIGTCTGRVWKTSDWISTGQTYVEVELSKTYGSDYYDNLWEVKAGEKVWVEVHDAEVAVEQVATGNLVKRGFSSKFISLAYSIFGAKGYNVNWTSQEWYDDYLKGIKATYNQEFENWLRFFKLPLEYKTEAELITAVQSVPQKQNGGGGGENDDKDKKDEEETSGGSGNMLMYGVVGFLLAKKLGLFGKGKKGSFL